MDLARIHRRLGAYDQAREHLQRAIIVDPLNPEPVGELASLDLAAGRFDAALAGYERAAELARTSRQRAGVLSQLKDYHRFRGQMEAAIRAAEAWLAEVSGVFSPREIAQRRLDDIGIYLVGSRQRVRTCSARPWLQTWDGSRRRTASTRWPSPTTGMRWLRMIGPLTCIAGSQPRRARRGAWDEAEAGLEAALRLVPSDPYTHLEMARVLEARGDSAGAVEHLGSALLAWEIV